MEKWLTGATETGEKILQNINLFRYSFENKEKSTARKESIYKFNWSYGDQNGYINIMHKNGKISNSSLIDTNTKSKHKFDRPLGLYNDSSLFRVFQMMLNSIDIEVEGIYSDF
ncbi:MAG: hypothetical protein ACM3ZR_13070 [Pseudomonadota bacterium]